MGWIWRASLPPLTLPPSLPPSLDALLPSGIPALVSRHDVTHELQYYGQVGHRGPHRPACSSPNIIPTRPRHSMF